MAIEQVFNKRTDSWVKYKKTKKGCVFLDNKQKMPTIPFVGIPIKGNKKK